MVALSDETRFKNLPTTEEWLEFREAVENQGSKILIIEETYWHNSLTRCKGKVKDIPVFASIDDGDRCTAVVWIQKFTCKEGDSVDDYKYDDNPWVFNKDYSHTNITTSDSYHTVKKPADEDGTIHGYRIYGHDICCPITRHHLFYRDLNELTMIFKGQLMGQNPNSPFRTVESVANNYKDIPIRESRGAFIKRTAPIIQLLVRMSLNDITQADDLAEKISSLTLPSDESEILVKRIDSSSYSVMKVEDYEAGVDKDFISCYYPIITYEQTKDILANIPKIPIHFGVMGLGSASTGILDQIVRGTFFNKYLICDFDYVEEKNLRNQWYIRSNIGQAKVNASRVQIGCIKNLSNMELIQKPCKFQDANLNAYDFKYLVSGFDSIDCRLELLNYVEEGKARAKYIIDTRYDDLASSIFIIDTENKDEVEYYKQGLLSDKEAFDKEEEKHQLKSFDEFKEWLENAGAFSNTCTAIHRELFEVTDMTPVFDECKMSCHGEHCIEHFQKIWEEHQDKIKKHCSNKPHEESSCVKQNFIDIYKYSSAFVFAAIRAIESGEDKPFTHIEATTDGIPRSMTLRK